MGKTLDIELDGAIILVKKKEEPKPLLFISAQ
jgi:hypothetical protein